MQSMVCCVSFSSLGSARFVLVLMWLRAFHSVWQWQWQREKSNITVAQANHPANARESHTHTHTHTVRTVRIREMKMALLRLHIGHPRECESVCAVLLCGCVCAAVLVGEDPLKSVGKVCVYAVASIQPLPFSKRSRSELAPIPSLGLLHTFYQSNYSLYSARLCSVRCGAHTHNSKGLLAVAMIASHSHHPM